MQINNFVKLIYLLIFFPTVGFAWDFGLDLGYQATYSTNSDRVSTDEQAQWIHEPSVTTSLSHDSNALELDALYNYSRRIYQQDDDGRFDDEDLLTGESTLNWNIVPDRLVFGVEHFRSIYTINAGLASGPNNRQEGQRVAASIDYSQPTVGSHYLNARASTSESTYEDTDNDSETDEVRLAYVVPVSDFRRWEVAAKKSETSFNDFEIFDYSLTSGEVVFISEAPTGSLFATLGYTETDPDSDLIDSVSGVTGSLDFRRGVSTPLEWRINLSREIGDRSLSLDRGSLRIDADPELVDSGLAEVFTSTLASVEMIATRGTNQFAVSLAADDEDFVSGGDDRRSETARFRFSRQMRSNLDFSTTVSYAEVEFDESDQEDEIVQGRIDLSWEASRRLRVAAAIAYEDRTSNLPFVEYSEWLGSITVTYALFTRNEVD